MKRNENRIFIWGTSEKTDLIVKSCRTLSSYSILGFIDNDKNKWGTYHMGYMVFSPEVLYEEHPDYVVLLMYNSNPVISQIERMFPHHTFIVEDRLFFVKNSIYRRYADTDDEEINTVVDYIKANSLGVFNYPFVKPYYQMTFDVRYDENCGMFYVIHGDKNLYFKSQLDSREKVENYYRELLIEQDILSPHRYTTSSFDIKKGDILLDVGAAEGIFSLEKIEAASKVIIVESDRDWINALKKTFSNYIEKVVIINKYATVYDEGDYCRLDTVINEKIDFVKMDIEGEEWNALNGMEGIITQSDELRIVACSYHRDCDQELIESFFDKHSIIHETSDGYMWFPNPEKDSISNSLNRGVIRGIRRLP